MKNDAAAPFGRRAGRSERESVRFLIHQYSNLYSTINRTILVTASVMPKVLISRVLKLSKLDAVARAGLKAGCERDRVSPVSNRPREARVNALILEVLVHAAHIRHCRLLIIFRFISYSRFAC